MVSKDRGWARMAAGLANYRRIKIVRLLQQHTSLSVGEAASLCEISRPTAVVHLLRLHEFGLIKNKSKGRRVLVTATNCTGVLRRRTDLLWEASD